MDFVSLRKNYGPLIVRKRNSRRAAASRIELNYGLPLVAADVAARRKTTATDQVAPGNVTAHSAAIQINQCQYICSAMNGSSSPFEMRSQRAIFSAPLPVNTIAANSVARLIKL